MSKVSEYRRKSTTLAMSVNWNILCLVCIVLFLDKIWQHFVTSQAFLSLTVIMTVNRRKVTNLKYCPGFLAHPGLMTDNSNTADCHLVQTMKRWVKVTTFLGESHLTSNWWPIAGSGGNCLLSVHSRLLLAVWTQPVVQLVGWTMQMSPAKRRLSGPARTFMTSLSWYSKAAVWTVDDVEFDRNF